MISKLNDEAPFVIGRFGHEKLGTLFVLLILGSLEQDSRSEEKTDLFIFLASFPGVRNDTTTTTTEINLSDWITYCRKEGHNIHIDTPPTT